MMKRIVLCLLIFVHCGAFGHGTWTDWEEQYFTKLCRSMNQVKNCLQKTHLEQAAPCRQMIYKLDILIESTIALTNKFYTLHSEINSFLKESQQCQTIAIEQNNPAILKNCIVHQMEQELQVLERHTTLPCR